MSKRVSNKKGTAKKNGNLRVQPERSTRTRRSKLQRRQLPGAAAPIDMAALRALITGGRS